MKKLFQKIANAVTPARRKPAQDIVELDPDGDLIRLLPRAITP
jgi:hypothetical protein